MNLCPILKFWYFTIYIFYIQKHVYLYTAGSIPKGEKKRKPYYVALFAMSMDVYISLVGQYILTGGKRAIGEVAIDIWCGCKL